MADQDGWLQIDPHRWGGTLQRIGVSPDGLQWASNYLWWIPLWIKVSGRIYNIQGRVAEIAVQVYTDPDHLYQIMYGGTATSWGGDPVHTAPETFPIYWDHTTQPEDPEGSVGWPTGFPGWQVGEITINWLDLPGGVFDVVTYGLEWWWEMLFNFGNALKTQLELTSWTQTLAADYSLPDATVLMVDDDLDVLDIKAMMNNGLVVVHGLEEVEPGPNFMGSPRGREGRQYEAQVSVFARSQAGLTGSEREIPLIQLGYYMEDIKQHLQPSAVTPNLLGGYLYYSQLELLRGPYRADVDGIDGSVARADFTFRGFKLQLEGEASEVASGDGVLFNFNQPFYQGDTGKLQNDHSVFYVAATQTWHQVGIYADLGLQGSSWFYHLTSPDLRTWTAQSGLQIGTDVDGNWRYQVWAPYIINNPNYGVGGAPLNSYKFLMFFTAVDHPNQANQKQKIGLAGTANEALTGWTILNSDAAIYWSGMATATYPAGAPWCPASTYDADWSGASRDPFVFTDGTDWYMVITAKKGGDASKQVVGLCKFSGGNTPDFTDPEHNATAVMEADTIGLYCESATCQLINGRWHFTTIGTGGTRHQSSTTHPKDDPFSDDVGFGVLINDTGPQVGIANEVFQVDGDTYYCSGHINQTTFYSYVMNKLDFSDLNSDPDGDYPTEVALHSIAGLVGLNEGVPDWDMGWSIIDSEGADSAFYRQPVWGDQADSAGYGPSGMTGNSYIATLFKHWHPGAGMDGDEWPDNTKVGAIQSTNFTITRNRISLMVGGGNHASTEFVALCRVDDDTILFSETGADSHVMSERIWDTSSLIGLSVYLVVVDNNTGSWGNISVDYIREYQESNLRDGATEPDPAGKPVTGLLP